MKRKKKIFKVVEIVSATTVRVSPEWTLDELTDKEQSGDLVKINGIRVAEDTAWVKRRLTLLLENRVVRLFNPIETSNPSMIQCNLFLDGNTITYYFPELDIILDAFHEPVFVGGQPPSGVT